MYSTFLIRHHKLTISHLGTNQAPHQTKISHLETNPIARPLLHLAPTRSNHYGLCCSFIHVQSRRPTKAKEEFSFSLVTTFVNISARFLLVCIFSSFKRPSSKTDRMKWYRNCMCFVLECRAEFLEELGHPQKDNYLFIDSQSVIHLVKNSALHSKTKHIQLQYHFIRSILEDGWLKIENIHTNDNPKNMLTKVVTREKLNSSSNLVGLLD